MRNPWQSGSSPRRGRRGSVRPGAVPNSSPFDFGADREEQVDPVDLIAIRTDDELLDALAGGGSFGSPFVPGAERQLDAGYTDDQQVLALLQAWRTEVDSEPLPELLSVEEASEAIVAGQRAARPRRRLMPVATAAAVVVLAMSGVAIGASGAQPGDPLWGVSTVLNGNRAKSVEAQVRVTAALTAAQQALSEGRTEDARKALSGAEADLGQVKDQERKDELSRKTANLSETVEGTHEGEKVETDEHGSRKDKPSDKDNRSDKDQRSGQNPGEPGANPSDSARPFDPRLLQTNPGQSQVPNPAQGQQPGQQGQQPSQPPGQPTESQKPAPSQRPAPQQQKPPPQETKPEKPTQTKPANEKPQQTKPANENKPPPEEKPRPKQDSGGGADKEGHQKDKPPRGGGSATVGQADTVRPRPNDAQLPGSAQRQGVSPAQPVS